MLSDFSKQLLRKTITEYPNIDLLRERGPHGVIGWLRDPDSYSRPPPPEAVPAIENIKANFEEAERFVAGLLGMT